MAAFGLPLLLSLLIWWVGTGLVFAVSALPAPLNGWTFLGATALLAAALFGAATTASDASHFGVYTAFVCAIAVWGWIEMSFLMGYVTGPRTAPCPDDCRGWQRFRLAAETLIYHELLIAAFAGVLVLLAWGAANPVAPLTFLILMTMRLSAKLNLFFGVPHFTDEMMPAHLAHLKSYFRKRPFNAFLPVSLIAATGVATVLAMRALDAAAPSGLAAGYTLLFGLMGLAIAEHVFMLIPVRDAALWRWAAPATEKAGS